jgi:hypothetical protein
LRFDYSPKKRRNQCLDRVSTGSNAIQKAKKEAKVFFEQAERLKKAAKRQGFFGQAQFAHPEDGQDKKKKSGKGIFP